MSEWNLWQSISVSLWIQRILCVSPFYLDRKTGKLKTDWKNKLYSVTVIFASLVGMYITASSNVVEEVNQFMSEGGLIWRLLNAYGFIAVNFHLILNLIIIWLGLSQQMQFLENIHLIDLKFLKSFNASVDHKRFKRNLTYGTILLYIYYGVRIIIYEIFLIEKEKIHMIIPSLMYSIKYIIINTQIFVFASYIFLIERRFQLLSIVYLKLERDYINYRKFGKFDKTTEHDFFMKFLKIFELFKEISNLVTIFNDAFGWIYASQIIHSFVSSLGQMFYVFLSNADKVISWSIMVSEMVYLIFGDGIKMFITAIAIHFVYDKVICENTFFFVDKMYLMKIIKFTDR